MKSLHTSAYENAELKNNSNAIKSLIEYAPITHHSEGGKKAVTIRATNGFGHLKLRQKLEFKHGIYIFYSSLCKPIYVGKAKKTNLWSEANSAFSRPLKTAVNRVNHPTETQSRSRSKLANHPVNMYDVVSYIQHIKLMRV